LSKFEKENAMRDKIQRAKELARKYSYELTFAGGIVVGIGIVAVSLKQPDYVEGRYPFGTNYNPDQPIPGLLLSEDEIKRDLVTGIMVAGFLEEKKLLKELVAFSAGWREELQKAYESRDSDADYPLLSRVKV
jgi:hypothetical protein